MSQLKFGHRGSSNNIGRRSALILAILLSGGNLLLPRIPLLFLLLVIALFILINRSIPLRRTKPILVLLCVIFVFWAIRPGDLDIVSLGIRYANFIGAFFLVLLYLKTEKNQLAEDLAWLMPWIAYQTLLTFMLANIFPGLFTAIQTPDGGSFNTIFLIFNYHNLIEGYTGWNRPNAIFFEPGVLQIYLNLYLFVSLFVLKRRNDAILATVATITTISTIGIVIAGLQLAFYFRQHWRTAGLRTKGRIAIVIIVLLPAWIIISTQNIEDKFFGESRGSSMARTFDLLAGLQVIQKYPILGIGFDHNRYLAEINNLPDFSDITGYTINPERATSNGILNITYSMGIPLAMIFLFGLFRQRVLPHGKAVGLIIFICSLGEALLFTPFFLLFVFSGLLLKPKNLRLDYKKIITQ